MKISRPPAPANASSRSSAVSYTHLQTTAQVVKTLYRTIQAAAGNALVIGCNTFNHLAAGIHAIQRSGDDTSGRSWEWTRRFGCNALMRLPQNNAFFRVDPDCAAFTEKVPADMNLLFLEACALSGSVTLARCV